MPFSIANKQGRQVLKLEGAVTIRHALDLAARLGDLEDGTLVAAGTLTITDPDTGQSTFQAITGLQSTYGSLSMTAYRLG